MTQSTMRIHANAMPANTSVAAKPKPKANANVKPSTSASTAAKPSSVKASTSTNASDNVKASAKHDEQKNQPRPAETPSDVIANAASETKTDRGVYASMKRAMSPYVEHHSHAVLYGIIGFIAAALILLVGFWPTVLLAVFAAIGVVIGKYRDGDRKTRAQMKQLLNRINQ